MNIGHGEVQEWLNWPLSKSGMGQLIEGSNPSLSAIKNGPYRWAIFYGTPDTIRTYDLRLRKPTLYPAELRVRVGATMQAYHNFTEVTR